MPLSCLGGEELSPHGSARSRLLQTIIPLTVVLLLLAAGCSPQERRPSIEEWRPSWEGVQAAIPRLEELPEPPDRDGCREVLVAVREARDELLPTPDPTVDEPVGEWIQVAESVFFQCPPHTPPIDSFAVGYEEMGRLAAEVEAGLGFEADDDD